MEHGTKVYVRVVSRETPSGRLTEILGLEPDEHWDAGSLTVIGSTTKKRPLNCWAIVEPITVDEDESDAVERLIARIGPKKDRFLQLPPGSVVELLVTITTPHDVFGFGLSAEQLRFCTSIGASLEMSLVVDGPGGGPTAPQPNENGRD